MIKIMNTFVKDVMST